MNIRSAVSADAEGISAVLRQLVAAKKRTRPSDVDFARTHYVEDPRRIDCFVAEDEDGQILGLQCLKLALEDNEYGAPAGWGIIGTHVSPNAARRGVGKQLFAATQEAAQRARLQAIEAYIGADNLEGQAYYEAMGFRTYRLADGAVCKAYEVRQGLEAVSGR